MLKNLCLWIRQMMPFFVYPPSRLRNWISTASCISLASNLFVNYWFASGFIYIFLFCSVGYCAIAVMVCWGYGPELKTPRCWHLCPFPSPHPVDRSQIFALWTNGAWMLCCATLSQLCSLSLCQFIALFYLSSMPSSYPQGVYSWRPKLLSL